MAANDETRPRPRATQTSKLSNKCDSRTRPAQCSTADILLKAQATSKQASKQLTPANKQLPQLLLLLHTASTSAMSPTSQRTIATTRSLTLALFGLLALLARLALAGRQLELIKQNPGSLEAVDRALKMAIFECRYQMRHEQWNCPIYGFSTKPGEVFGRLMSRSFKETSFIHSLLSAAIAHSVARACAEGTISTCGAQKNLQGDKVEDIGFGLRFSHNFTEAMHEHASLLGAGLAANASSAAGSGPTSDPTIVNNNQILDASMPAGALGASVSMEPSFDPHQQQQQQPASPQDQQQQQQFKPLEQQQQLQPHQAMEPSRRERKIRSLINAHNDNVGRLLVFNGMKRDCKCHGLSGACTLQNCWIRLPPFRDVANQLHAKLEYAVRVIYVSQKPAGQQQQQHPQLAQHQSQQQASAESAPKSLTSAPSVKKTNKKRSSSQPVNGLNARSSIYQQHSSVAGSSSTNNQRLNSRPDSSSFSSPSASSAAAASSSLPSPSPPSAGPRRKSAYPFEASLNALISDTASTSIIGSRPRAGSKRHTSYSSATSDNDCEDCPRAAPDAPNSRLRSRIGAQTDATSANSSTTSHHLHDARRPLTELSEPAQDNLVRPGLTALAPNSTATTPAPAKKRPVARYIGSAVSHVISPDKFDLLYYEDSPDFCMPSDRYNIKGTKGRVCSENPDASNSCDRLCCGRGYKTEVREEKYKCECQFIHCCELACNTCTRRKMIHVCL